MDRQVEVTAGFCLLMALMLLILPLEWLLALGLAVMLHELGHILALGLLDVPIFGITLSGRGVLLSVGTMLPHQAFLCALAGPLVSISLWLWVGWIPRAALLGMVQGIFNLLPVLPLDGGRAVAAVLDLCCPGKRDRIMDGIRRCLLLLVLILGVWGTWKLGITGAVWTFLLMVRLHPIKIPCKAAWKRVQ